MAEYNILSLTTSKSLFILSFENAYDSSSIRRKVYYTLTFCIVLYSASYKPNFTFADNVETSLKPHIIYPFHRGYLSVYGAMAARYVFIQPLLSSMTCEKVKRHNQR